MEWGNSIVAQLLVYLNLTKDKLRILKRIEIIIIY